MAVIQNYRMCLIGETQIVHRLSTPSAYLRDGQVGLILLGEFAITKPVSLGKVRPSLQHPLPRRPKRMKRKREHHVMRHVPPLPIAHADCAHIAALCDLRTVQRGRLPGRP